MEGENEGRTEEGRKEGRKQSRFNVDVSRERYNE